MREIDFLPEWYKSGRRRRVSYRTQYIALGGVFVVMMMWNFMAAHSVSKAASELAYLESKASVAERASREFAEVKSQIAQLRKEANVLEKIDSKIDVASVLAEMSFLIDDRVILSKVEFVAERFVGRQENKVSGGSVVRVARPNFGEKQGLLPGDVRFRVAIRGVAADAGDVAELVCELEDSPYFCQVMPSWRNGKIKVATGSAGENHRVSEFEISCYLANYEEVISD